MDATADHRIDAMADYFLNFSFRDVPSKLNLETVDIIAGYVSNFIFADSPPKLNLETIDVTADYLSNFSFAEDGRHGRPLFELQFC